MNFLFIVFLFCLMIKNAISMIPLECQDFGTTIGKTIIKPLFQNTFKNGICKSSKVKHKQIMKTPIKAFMDKYIKVIEVELNKVCTIPPNMKPTKVIPPIVKECFYENDELKNHDNLCQYKEEDIKSIIFSCAIPKIMPLALSAPGFAAQCCPKIKNLELNDFKNKLNKDFKKIF